MNLKHKNALKKLGWTVNLREIYKKIRQNFGYSYDVNLIDFSLIPAETCCGVNELGDFKFHDEWNKLSKELRIACFEHIQSKANKFIIIYALEIPPWNSLSEILPDCGFIPAARWKNPVTGKMIQTWYKNPNVPKRKTRKKRRNS